MVRNRHLFAGSNGGDGFYSLFENIIEPDFKRVYLLKGGPGTGKSSFMRYLADALEQEGYGQELFFCSSDSGSLDAVSFPALGVALVDATHPHAQEGKWPGCRDQLICLGDFWSGSSLEERRQEIVQGGMVKQAHFQAAFRYFSAASLMEDNLASRNVHTRVDCHEQVAEILGQIRQIRSHSLAKPSQARHLFSSALTPEGYVSYIEDLVEEFSKIYILRGPAGSGKSDYIAMVVASAQAVGLRVEVFHYPLNPKKLLHILIPDLELAVLTATDLQPLTSLEGETITCSRGSAYGQENAGDRRLFKELLQLGIESLQAARAGHSKVEDYYVRAMDFEALNRRRQEVLDEILSYKNRS